MAQVSSLVFLGALFLLLSPAVCITNLEAALLKDKFDPPPGEYKPFTEEPFQPFAIVNISSSKSLPIVKPCGIKFCVGGKTYFATGPNVYSLSVPNIYSRDSMENSIATHASAGANTIRVFTHSEGYTESMVPIQTKFGGGLNEKALQHLDLMLALCAKYNVRVIMTLTNYWTSLGGVPWYVYSAYWPSAYKQLFYQSPKIIEAYKNFVKALVGRTNSVTGEKYANDGTIFSWELGNELQTDWGAEKKSKPGTMVRQWACQMAGFIKSMDSNHMVSFGGEGFMTDGTTLKGQLAFLDNGAKGEDFRGIISCANIDFATVHPYPQAWGVPNNGYSWLGPDYLYPRAKAAHDNGKPIIIEEFGISTTGANKNGGRNGYFRMLLSYARFYDYAGFMPWGLSRGNGGGKDSISFGYSEDGGAAIKEAYKIASVPTANKGSLCEEVQAFGQNILCSQKTCAATNSCPEPSKKTFPPHLVWNPSPVSLPCKDVQPPNDPTMCYLRASWGQCKMDWVKGYCNFSCNRCPKKGKDKNKGRR